MGKEENGRELTSELRGSSAAADEPLALPSSENPVNPVNPV